MKKIKAKKENYYFLKLLHNIFNISFYIAALLVFLSLAVAVIIIVVKVDADHMLLPPFMKRNFGGGGEVESYVLHIGNGIKVTVAAEKITLDDIKAAVYSGLFLLTAVLATAVPVIKFFAALMRNIINGFPDDIKNLYYVYYIGICLSAGGVIIKFVTRFYNYKLISVFVEDAAAVIELDLNLDILYAVPGLLVIFTAFLFGCIRKSRIANAQQIPDQSRGLELYGDDRFVEEKESEKEKKNKDDI